MKYFVIVSLLLKIIVAQGQHTDIDKNYKTSSLNISSFFEALNINSLDSDTITFNLLVKQNCFIDLRTVLNEMRFNDSNYYSPFFKDLKDLDISEEAKIISSFKIGSHYSSYLIEKQFKGEFYSEISRYLINTSKKGYTIFQVTYCHNTGLSAKLDFVEIRESCAFFFKTSIIMDLPNSDRNQTLTATKEFCTYGNFKN